jgi:PAS domain S-box-containing protein
VSDRHRALFELAPDAYIVMGGDRIVEANRAARELCDCVGRSVREVFDDAEPLLAAIAAGIEGRMTFELARTRDGETRRFEIALTNLDGPGGHAIIARDVTLRRRREELWERYQLLSENAHDIVLFIRRDGSVLEANAAAAHAYGYSRDEMRRLKIHDLRAPATRDTVPDQMRQAVDRGALFETAHIRRDGTTFPVEVSSRPALLGDEPVLVSIIRDLSERNAMQARLLQSDRMAAVGMLAAGVAHEINNPLAYAFTNLEVLGRTLSKLGRALDECGAPREALEDLELAEQTLAIAKEGSDRVRAIVRDLKTFSRADELQRGPVDVCAVLDSCINMAAAELRHRAHMIRDYEGVPPVEASESRLAQVFLNLLVNAAQALPVGAAEQNEIHVAIAKDSDARVRVEVRDSGKGMSPSVRARIFDPFYTTKPVGEGTGLGLSICQSIITGLGGTISADSQPGAGSVFTVTLPSAQVQTPAEPQRGGSARAAVRRARVLVIDDNTMYAKTLPRLLEGHDVTLAASGMDALDRLRSGESFDLILCDLMMPVMTGMDVHAAISRERPELLASIVFVTGGAFTAGARAFLDAVPNVCVEKPAPPERLLELVLRHTG